ncbi:hypothetical protein Tco_1398492 [Tanacetum coccineum]
MEEALPLMDDEKLRNDDLSIWWSLEIKFDKDALVAAPCFGIDDDEVPNEEVSQDLWEEISGKVDETQLQKAINDMLRQRNNSGEKHKYHVD